jgi:23S rRNA (pseudouridine1915-N3)-methyltransferase
MKLLLLAAGRIRSAPLREICAEYGERLRRYGAFEVLEVKSAGGLEEAVALESRQMLAALAPSDQVLVLDERGSQMTSAELAGLLQASELRGVKRLVFMLGGAYGLSAEARQRGKNLSLSKMTLPHELCRAVLLEQLYLARTIQRGEPYHHSGQL